MSRPTLFLAPHNDDETLFGAFTLLRYQPTVVICLASHRQPASYGDRSTNWEERTLETGRAMRELGIPDWYQWPYSDADPDWDSVEAGMRALDLHLRPEAVFAPAIEDGGHEQHNEVGRIAERVYEKRIVSYLTYRRGHLRTRSEKPVAYEPDWPARKLRALACYASQIAMPQTAPWFLDDTLREYLA